MALTRSYTNSPMTCEKAKELVSHLIRYPLRCMQCSQASRLTGYAMHLLLLFVVIHIRVTFERLQFVPFCPEYGQTFRSTPSRTPTEEAKNSQEVLCYRSSRNANQGTYQRCASIRCTQRAVIFSRSRTLVVDRSLYFSSSAIGRMLANQ